MYQEDMMSNTTIPFGILFEERRIISSQKIVTPEYDPVEGVSYIINLDGRRVPYIEWIWTSFSTQTGLATKVNTDPTDTDPGDDSPYYLAGTQTFTEIKEETTDKD
jgi:hypothetical protein